MRVVLYRGGCVLGVDCLRTGSVCVQSTFSCLGTYESITYEYLQQRNMIRVLEMAFTGMLETVFSSTFEKKGTDSVKHISF